MAPSTAFPGPAAAVPAALDGGATAVAAPGMEFFETAQSPEFAGVLTGDGLAQPEQAAPGSETGEPFLLPAEATEEPELWRERNRPSISRA